VRAVPGQHLGYGGVVVAEGIPGGADVPVLDPRLRERGAQGRLREAAPSRDGERPDVHDALHTIPKKISNEVIEPLALVANRHDLAGSHDPWYARSTKAASM
jgi:hypothetical protein